MPPVEGPSLIALSVRRPGNSEMPRVVPAHALPTELCQCENAPSVTLFLNCAEG